jgi:AcrR family transcriptional regulator
MAKSTRDEPESVLASAWAGSAAEKVLAPVRPETKRRLLHAALDLFESRGYHATTARQISVGAGMNPAGLYVHYASKEAILFELSRLAHEDSFNAIEAAQTAQGADEQVRSLVYAFTVWHGRNLKLARVAQHGMADLAEGHFREIAALRRRIERVFGVEVERGIRSGEFEAVNTKGATLAIMAWGIDLVRWYRPDGRKSAAAVAQIYADLASNMLRAKSSG